jgi:thioredoxin-related protein
LRVLDDVQLDINSDAPVLTPAGQHLTAKQWANKLGIYYAPTIVFFDEAGKEILRIDSVVRFYRLTNVLHYIISGDYKHIPNFQHWRIEKKR